MRKIVPLILAAAMLLAGCTSADKNQGAAETAANAQPNKTVFIMAGKIEANEKADLTSKIPAKVLEIKVDIGSTVKQGDTIIKLDTKDLEAQVGQAQAAVNTASANLVKMQSGARSEQIAQAKAALGSSSNSYESAKNNYDRMSQLFQTGAVSKQQFEAAEGQLKAAEAKYISDKNQLDILNKGETKETLDVLEAQVKQAEAALELAKTQLNNGTITAPISGVVSTRNINVGEIASAGMPLVSIVNAGALYINAYLPASLVGEVKAGQEAVIGISEIQGKEFQGEISVIDPVIDSKGKNILVKVKLKTTDSTLKPGMFAQIGIKK